MRRSIETGNSILGGEALASGAQAGAAVPIPVGAGEITVAGVTLVADLAGALYWPEQGLLAVADLHLEKGSSFAARGQLLPPYDTGSTLARLARVISGYAPRCVVALGDSFHDGGGPGRLSDDDRSSLRGLQRGRDWIWITGNHDPEPAEGIGGLFQATLTIGALTFRHEPKGAPGELGGGATSPPTRPAWSCPRSAHLPAVSMFDMPRLPICSARSPSQRICLVMPGFTLLPPNAAYRIE